LQTIEHKTNEKYNNFIPQYLDIKGFHNDNGFITYAFIFGYNCPLLT